MSNSGEIEGRASYLCDDQIDVYCTLQSCPWEENFEITGFVHELTIGIAKSLIFVPLKIQKLQESKSSMT